MGDIEKAEGAGAPNTSGQPTRDKWDAEVHPSWGLIGANRVSQGGAGAVLFDSDVRHNHYVILRIGRASRRRDLHRDWVGESGGRGELVEVAMSEAQWASMISSMNTSGVPCTIRRTEKDGQMPELDFDSRLDLTHKEVREKAEDAVEEVKRARDAYAERKTAANLRALHFAIENLPANFEFAAKSLTEHAEAVVQKSRADVEAFVMHKAQQLGLDPQTWTPVEELEGADEDRKELEG
jgi:hypothetical protein